MLCDLVKMNRSYRRFEEAVPIPEAVLTGLAELARYIPSGANQQPLKYRIVCRPEENRKVFETLKWAGALPDWDGPEEGERPTGYIVILCDKMIGSKKQWDEGIAAQTIMLGAVEAGFGGCMLGSIDRRLLAEHLNLDPERYLISLVLALGKPKEKVVIVPLPEDGSTAYYRDGEQIHYVPKRALSDMLVQ